MSDINAKRSIYRRGADDGLWFGIYLSVLFIVSVCAVSATDILSLLSMAMIVAVPVIIYILLKRSYKEDDCNSQFSALWLHGICIFFFGCTIMALTSYIYLRLINPSFYHDTVAMALDMLKEAGIPSDDMNVKVLTAMQKENAFPTAGQTAMQLILMGVFTGSILSMFISMIVRATTRRTTPPPHIES